MNSITTAPEFIRVKRRRDEDSVQALCMCCNIFDVLGNVLD